MAIRRGVVLSHLRFLRGCLTSLSRSSIRSRHYLKMLKSKTTDPPTAVKGMTEWNPDLFQKTITVPFVECDASYVSAAKKFLDKHILKMPNIQPIQNRTVNSVDAGVESAQKIILLDPDKVTSMQSIPEDSLANLSRLSIHSLQFRDLTLNLSNWQIEKLLDAVLIDPEKGIPSLTSFSLIGHIIHVNLKEHHLPFKRVIGQILLLARKAVRVVVNKSSSIDNTYRNFSFEVLSGKCDSYVAHVKENCCKFEFDFSKVYWNPRLATEHERIIAKLSVNDILVDVFAGVGPFAIPAAKKCLKVFANDLNPESYHWLKHNAQLNKVRGVQCYNMDGRDFIRHVFANELDSLKDAEKVHIVMNLPALAETFLDEFCGLLESNNELLCKKMMVHVYMFTKDVENGINDVRERCEKVLHHSLQSHIDETVFVRKVAPNKDMYRLSMCLPDEILKDCSESQSEECHPSKRLKVE